MASQYGKLVNKQFNSPIKLYSENNIRDVLDRESQMLSNGAVGINFHNPTTNKPANLQNSAVLRFLEEEEQRKKGGTSSLKRVAWPPASDAEGHLSEISLQDLDGPQISSGGLQNNQSPSANYQQPPTYQPTPVSPIYRPVSPNPNAVSPSVNYQHQPPVSSVYRPVSPNPNVNYQQQQPIPVYRPVSPRPGVNLQQSATPLSPNYQSNAAPPQYSPAQAGRQWAPVHSPSYQQTKPQSFTSPQPYSEEPLHSQQYQERQHQFAQPYADNTQPWSPQVTQQQQPNYVVPQQQYQQQTHRPAPVVEPPATTIRLRQETPVSQIPPSVYTSQPATATLQGGKNLRGDLKWPPPETKAQMELENKARIELARGPVCRPRKVRRDYSEFFAQHALNDGYPRYKIPPGTQFYVPERMS